MEPNGPVYGIFLYALRVNLVWTTTLVGLLYYTSGEGVAFLVLCGSRLPARYHKPSPGPFVSILFHGLNVIGLHQVLPNNAGPLNMPRESVFTTLPFIYFVVILSFKTVK